jgi:hypothetical protein
MRLPRVRFTVRRMMIAVAVVGVALGMCLWMVRRSKIFRERSNDHGRTWAAMMERGMEPGNGLADYHRRLSEKYDRAALIPWLPVAPDPPEPE